MKNFPPLLSVISAAAALCAVPAAAGTSLSMGDELVAQAAATTPADVAADLDFLLRAWRANVQELGAARLAMDRSRDVRVRQFARVLVREHSAANVHFQRLGASRGLGVPAAVRGDGVAAEFGLEGLRGVAFDRQFVASAGVQAHRDAVELFRQEAEHGRDRALVRFASASLPMLRKHLARAEALQAQFELRRRNFAPAR
ncbi:DUF4142 domain-containing protein [Ramlibacter sp. AN1133]|uniref:DUF4142 domain-containing protein n=1 Tax=Ramlibacter sp. AN1133 TaxID=3133429 RepID=UPI0030BD8052